MIKDKVSLSILLVGLPLSATLYGLAYFLDVGTIIFVVLGFIAFLFTVFSAHAIYTWRKFMEEEKHHLSQMNPCEYCGKPIYKDDEKCPYCHKVQTRHDIDEK
jgi:Zn finger protein HypA/HybF involved in hydrogenase expression